MCPKCNSEDVDVEKTVVGQDKIKLSCHCKKCDHRWTRYM
jgi:transcriptional regulator NrdR family protein